MSCLSFDISVKPVGSMEVSESSAHLDIDLSCSVGCMDIAENSPHLSMGIDVKPTGFIEIGFVCGTDIGFPVLYASDGALITIDGKYLIVRK